MNFDETSLSLMSSILKYKSFYCKIGSAFTSEVNTSHVNVLFIDVNNTIFCGINGLDDCMYFHMNHKSLTN